ncbi:unnamed protein product [Eretmochelys imbricata]
MVTIPGSAIVLIWLFISCCEAQVDQSPQSLATWEGEVVTMSCAFTTKYQTFHWYQQLPGRDLTYLLAVSPQENATEQRISCCKAQVVQSPEWLVTGEGEVTTMSCSFTSAYRTFYWYQQLPGQGPTHLLTTSSNDNTFLGLTLLRSASARERRTELTMASESGATLWGLLITFIFLCEISCCESQVVQSPEWLVTGEGEVTTMSCSFTSAYQTFYWYQQRSRQKPANLLTASSNDKVTVGRFIGYGSLQLPVTMVHCFQPMGGAGSAASRSSHWPETVHRSHWELPAALPADAQDPPWTDSASVSASARERRNGAHHGLREWSCFVEPSPHLFSLCEAQVVQSPEWLVAGEGEVSTLSCSFTSAYQAFQWYQQLPGQGPTHLLTASSNDNVTVGRFIGERLESGKRSSLHITDSHLGDSGSYLCAVDAQ